MIIKDLKTVFLEKDIKKSLSHCKRKTKRMLLSTDFLGARLFTFMREITV